VFKKFVDESPWLNQKYEIMAYIQVHEVTDSETINLTFRLRYDVWNGETELNAPIRELALIKDEHDQHARHWAAYDGNELVAAARMCIHHLQQETPDALAFRQIRLPTPIATINRLVVKKQWRRQGISKQLDVFRIQAAHDGNAACVVVTTPPERISSLQKRGFRLTEFLFSPFYADTLLARGMVLIFERQCEGRIDK